MRLKRVGDWIEYMTEIGKTFYYNEKTGDFRWENPAIDPEGKSAKTQKSDWKPYKDPETGAVFWYNSVTNVSQWNCPDELSKSMIGSFDIEGKGGKGAGGGGYSQQGAGAKAGGDAGWYIHAQADPYGLNDPISESNPHAHGQLPQGRAGATSASSNEGYDESMLNLAFDGNHGGEEEVVQVIDNDDLGI
jgi:hypothetical protein